MKAFEAKRDPKRKISQKHRSALKVILLGTVTGLIGLVAFGKGKKSENKKLLDKEPASAPVALELARDQLQAQLSATDSDDLKAFGFFAADLTGAGTMYVSHNVDYHWWFISVLIFMVAATLMMIALKRKTFHPGPEPLAVYFSSSKTPILDAISSVISATEEITIVRAAKTRRFVYQLSECLLCLGVLVSALEIWVLH